MTDCHRIVYIGNSYEALQMLRSVKELCVCGWLYQAGKIRSAESLLPGLSGSLTATPVRGKADLAECLETMYPDVDFAIMYDFGIIVPEAVISRMPVFNFHPGDLRTNRGSSPVNWAVLLAWKSTGMSLYRISAGIDLGGLVSFHSCRIYPDDTPLSLRYRLQSEIPGMLFELFGFLRGERDEEPVTEGIYRRRIVEDDYTIHSGSDADEIVRAKIQSQHEYEGAILLRDGRREYVRSFAEYRRIMSGGGYVSIVKLRGTESASLPSAA